MSTKKNQPDTTATALIPRSHGCKVGSLYITEHAKRMSQFNSLKE